MRLLATGNKGFTLIEILITIFIIASFIGASNFVFKKNIQSPQSKFLESFNEIKKESIEKRRIINVLIRNDDGQIRYFFTDGNYGSKTINKDLKLDLIKSDKYKYSHYEKIVTILPTGVVMDNKIIIEYGGSRKEVSLK